ncbi:1667_t:CDS:2 [Gigaspora rosea]|nr:1667_t:CDS:2 [Gigaspora rosea]
MEITNQESESDFLDDEIIVDLSSSDDSKASNIAQIMERYIQIVDEPVATEGMLNDEEIITMVQAEENEQEQESDDDEEPPPLPVIAKEVYNAIQTVLRYEEQTNSESNLELAELEFLRKLNNNYRQNQGYKFLDIDEEGDTFIKSHFHLNFRIARFGSLICQQFWRHFMDLLIHIR